MRAAEAIGYVGAGTVEFITDASAGLRPDRFYFMEMNTRLQVEHPVTEAITGVDLVEWQLLVAAGEPLPLRQDQLAITGWAFEARLYAEDPATGFLPAIGRLERLDLPADRVRIDSGVRPGDRIAPYYDPMIAKIVSHGPTRATALNQLAAALGQARIAGTVTNLEFLGALCRHPGVAAGAVDTGLIERDLGQLVRSEPPPAEAVALAGLAELGLLAPAQGDDPWDRLVGWRAWQPAEHHLTLLWQDETYALAVLLDGRGRFRVSLAERTLEIDVLGSAEGGCRVALDGRRQDVGSHLHGDQVSLFLAGRHYAFQRPDLLAAPAMAAAAGGDRLLAPMPGLVRVIFAAPGQAVRQGEPLLVLEAMKMEHSLPAPANGVVAELAVRAGDQVQAGALLLTLTLAEP